MALIFIFGIMTSFVYAGSPVSVVTTQNTNRFSRVKIINNRAYIPYKAYLDSQSTGYMVLDIIAAFEKEKGVKIPVGGWRLHSGSNPLINNAGSIQPRHGIVQRDFVFGIWVDCVKFVIE